MKKKKIVNIKNVKKNSDNKENGKGDDNENKKENKTKCENKKKKLITKKINNDNIPITKLRPFNNEKEMTKIENVIKRKKLDSLKKKLNEYTKEKLMEKYREIKLKEKIERINAKKDLLDNLNKDKFKFLFKTNDGDVFNINGDISNNENENSIENNNENENGNENENENEYDSDINTEDSEMSSLDITSKFDDSYLEKSSEFMSDVDSNISSITSVLVEHPVSTASSKKEVPLIKKIYQRSTPKLESGKTTSSKSKTPNNSETNNNKYMKLDYPISQAYYFFCKKSSISINDYYSQFISENLSKNQINTYLNIKPPKSTQSSSLISVTNSRNTNSKENNLLHYDKEVTVDSGTSGIKSRQSYIYNPTKQKKPKIPIEKLKKLRTLQQLRVKIINSLISYNDNILQLKQLQKDRKELLKRKKTIEIIMNKKIGKLISEIDYLTNDMSEYYATKTQRRHTLEVQYNNFSKEIEKNMLELDIVYYKKKREYDNILKELQQLKQFEEKIHSHPEVLMKEIEILNDKIKEDEENYKNELKRMELREKFKEKELEELKHRNINFLILESYNHVSKKIIDAYIDRVESHKRLCYENRIQKEFQDNLNKEIEKLRKENEELKKNSVKMTNVYNTIVFKTKTKCSPNEVYKFESQHKNSSSINKRQILLNKIKAMKNPEIPIKKNASLSEITPGISPSNQDLFSEINNALKINKTNLLLYKNRNKINNSDKKKIIKEQHLYNCIEKDNQPNIQTT